jgi:hypothetical protein
MPNGQTARVPIARGDGLIVVRSRPGSVDGGERRSLGARLRLALFGLPLAETSFARRGFRPGLESSRLRLEAVGRAFLHGYHAALRDPDPAAIGAALGRTEAELSGFACEGAAMAVTLFDHLAPWRRDRFELLLRAHGERHLYMIHVGAGWAVARLRRPLPRALERFDPVHRWLVADGYGFHEGYFHWRQAIAAGARPGNLTGYHGRAFDQGLGRSLWFVEGADPEAVAARIDTFASERRPDLWSGVGLAAAYAGASGAAGLERLQELGGPHRAELAQGAAFAAKARLRAGNPAPHTELACQVFARASLAEAAGWTDDALRELPAATAGARPGSEIWRDRSRARARARIRDRIPERTREPIGSRSREVTR